MPSHSTSRKSSHTSSMSVKKCNIIWGVCFAVVAAFAILFGVLFKIKMDELEACADPFAAACRVDGLSGTCSLPTCKVVNGKCVPV
jgi:hypothetical protein